MTLLIEKLPPAWSRSQQCPTLRSLARKGMGDWLGNGEGNRMYDLQCTPPPNDVPHRLANRWGILFISWEQGLFRNTNVSGCGGVSWPPPRRWSPNIWQHWLLDSRVSPCTWKLESSLKHCHQRLHMGIGVSQANPRPGRGFPTMPRLGACLHGGHGCFVECSIAHSTRLFTTQA